MPNKNPLQPFKVSGYDTLSDVNKKLFEEFLNNFYVAWGLEALKTIKALSIKECNDAVGKYLRFDYKIYNRKDWLHVTSSSEWY